MGIWGFGFGFVSFVSRKVSVSPRTLKWAGGSACPAGVQQYGHIACKPLTRQSICVDSIVRYCQLGRRMQRFLQFWLGCHGLPNAAGRLAGAGHVDRANRVCLTCNSGAIGDAKHMIFERTALSLLKQQHAGLSHLALAPCARFSLSNTI